jgi:membrane fusion protein, multidrug efflux system
VSGEFMMTKNYLVCALLAVTLWISVGFGAGAKMAGGMPPAFVEIMKVQFDSLQQDLTAIGTLSADPGIIVRPEIAGRIVSIYFKSGDTVKVGTPLIELSSEIIRAQLAEYQATLNLDKLAFERASKLYQTRTVSKADYDQAQANLLASQAKVDGTNAAIRQTKIIAPFSGRLGLKAVNIGDYISTGQSIVSLNSLDPINVDFSIPEVYLSKITVGQSVQIHSDAYPNENFAGKVNAIESLINASSRTVSLRASIANKDGKLLPGAFVEVRLITGVKPKVILIPQSSVVYAADGNYVYSVVNGKAVKTLIELGEKDAKNVEVNKGLKAGDVIVTVGQLKIQEGSPVIPVKK